MTHLKVAVRVRPLSLREIEDNSSVILSVENGKTIAITNIKVPEQNAGDSRERIRRFTFDFCFHENSTQTDIFQAIEGVVNNAVRKRYHSCVLAYGQSSSGKTHTMMGFPHEPGLTPRLCEQVFCYLEEMTIGKEIADTDISVSYLEIYNEKVRDLLCKDEQLLKIRQHPKKGPYVQGLSEHHAADSASLLELLERGNGNRRVAATLTNPQSSRSHSVFVLTLDGVKLTLVDLAGSERAGNRCYSTSRLREGANINKSLVALGNVITALAEDSSKCSKGIRKRFIPYRDSILTWLLKDTLGGNAHTVMIATISPSSTCYSETVNTLRFGQRAKLIVSIPVVNEDPKERTIRELREEIAKLRQLLKLAELTPAIIPQKRDVESVEMNSPNERIKLYRTNSVVDQNLKKMENQRRFGSEETISKKPPRRDSTDKKSEAKKSEKSNTSDPKPKVEAKVDSIRKVPIKPRSQIVAAVTHRLYVKTKKKDAAVDTSDLPNSSLHRELSICSNARQQLRELSRKAAKSQKCKNEETQTELFPVLRMKEISTDVCDLKMSLDEVKDVETSTAPVVTEDKEINCTFLDSAKNVFVITKTCGVQASEKPAAAPSMVSFTKYLRDSQQPKLEIFNPHTANPIYTNSVNINISHNYINGQRVSDSVSDDSLDEQSNVCLPTPDLISNHNSLEPHAITNKDSLGSKICQAQCSELDLNTISVVEFSQGKLPTFVANCSTLPKHENRPNSINIPTVYATEICVVNDECKDFCEFFSPTVPDMVRSNIVECKGYSDDCVKVIEPLVLKSIMKFIPECRKQELEELPDSLEYHMTNSKKVRFTKTEDQNERMMKAMSSFLEEATILMNTLSTSAACRLDQEQEYDIQVNVSGLEQHKCRRKRKISRNSVKCQTEEKPMKSDYIQTEFDLEIPVNKYELLLEDSCRRLEQKIAAATEDNLNSWDLSVHEDTSLESNPVTFSDYGSLPRRRRPSCTPSAYLRQLATMRRQVVEASREELSNNSESSVS